MCVLRSWTWLESQLIHNNKSSYQLISDCPHIHPLIHLSCLFITDIILLTKMPCTARCVSSALCLCSRVVRPGLAEGWCLSRRVPRRYVQFCILWWRASAWAFKPRNSPWIKSVTVFRISICKKTNVALNCKTISLTHTSLISLSHDHLPDWSFQLSARPPDVWLWRVFQRERLFAAQNGRTLRVKTVWKRKISDVTHRTRKMCINLSHSRNVRSLIW